MIIDEIHAFAGDDRGWHLLAVLERVGRIAATGSGSEPQRIGLSATVGNPDALLDWLAGSCTGPRTALVPAAGAAAAVADVQIDHVGSIANAATVISRLHRGEKRLVFVESRSRAEQVCHELRSLGTTAFVTHSSLSRDERRQAEDAFAHRDDCVIVATSVLELGIDVGDLDRVIQIDSPGTVASFLQRMGRTGRRAGTVRNCLFLTTSDQALVRAAALVDLWATGFVEPIVPPPAPWHLLAQQLLAVTLQERGAGRRTWREWVGRMPAFAAMGDAEIERIVAHMLDTGILFEDGGVLGIGVTGEQEFGRRHFMELMSVFTSPPLFQVVHGREDLGQVDALSFAGGAGRPRVLLLGGRSWRVTHVDWNRRIAHVERVEGGGASRWRGGGPLVGFHFCRAMRDVLTTAGEREWWSRRTREAMARIRAEFAWLAADATTLRGSAGTTAGEPAAWWTFAGTQANAALKAALEGLLTDPLDADACSIRLPEGLALEDAERAIAAVRALKPADILPDVDPDAVEGLKFSRCLPPRMAADVVRRRLADLPAVTATMQEPVRTIVG